MSKRKPPIIIEGKIVLICGACKYESYVPHRDGNIHCYKCGRLLGSKVDRKLFIREKRAEVYTEVKHHRLPDGKLVARNKGRK